MIHTERAHNSIMNNIDTQLKKGDRIIVNGTGCDTEFGVVREIIVDQDGTTLIRYKNENGFSEYAYVWQCQYVG